VYFNRLTPSHLAVYEITYPHPTKSGVYRTVADLERRAAFAARFVPDLVVGPEVVGVGEMLVSKVPWGMAGIFAGSVGGKGVWCWVHWALKCHFCKGA